MSTLGVILQVNFFGWARHPLLDKPLQDTNRFSANDATALRAAQQV
jgi:hypothetical protein